MKINKLYYSFIKTMALTVALSTPLHANEVGVLDRADPAPSPESKDPNRESRYLQLKELFLIGQRDAAIEQAALYLNDHPTDGDVRLLLGKMYLDAKAYQKAREQLLMVLKQNPNYVDASIILINVQLALNNYQEALSIADSGLLLDPTNNDLLKKKADIIRAMADEKAPLDNKKVSSALSVSNLKKSVPEEYKQLDTLYLSGKHSEAINQAVAYLKAHSTDTDARLMLGKFYFNEKKYELARDELSKVLLQNPDYIDARLILINVEVALHNDSNALVIAKAGLALNPTNPELKLKVKSLRASMTRPANATKKISSPATGDVPRKKEEKKYLNEVGIYQQQYYISDVKSVWDYSTLYYGRATSLGKVYGKINYSNRFATQALQGEIEAYPQINKYLYLDLDVAFANQPNLFPDQVYGGEAYVTAGNGVGFSGGGKYNRVDQRHQFSMYTGSLYKQLSNNIVLFRPYYFVPGVGQNSMLYTINLRHFVSDPYFYFGCVFGYGKSPDLASLTTVNFLVLRNKIVNPYINFPLLNERLIVNLNLLYQNQVFPFSNRVRDWSGGTVGLVWRF